MSIRCRHCSRRLLTPAALVELVHEHQQSVSEVVSDLAKASRDLRARDCYELGALRQSLNGLIDEMKMYCRCSEEKQEDAA